MTSMFDEGCFVHERISSTGLDVCSSTVEGIKYEVLDGNGTMTELLQTEAMVGLSDSFSWSVVKILSILSLLGTALGMKRSIMFNVVP